MGKTVLIRDCDLEFVRVARTWIGVPFLHQGRSRAGVDCIGFILCVGAQTGRVSKNFERADYGRMADTDELIRKIKHYCEEIPGPELGCLMTMSWGSFPRHSAIYAGESKRGEPRMIHCYGRKGIQKVVEHNWTGPWPKVTTGFFRVPERVNG